MLTTFDWPKECRPVTLNYASFLRKFTSTPSWNLTLTYIHRSGGNSFSGPWLVLQLHDELIYEVSLLNYKGGMEELKINLISKSIGLFFPGKSYQKGTNSNPTKFKELIASVILILIFVWLGVRKWGSGVGWYCAPRNGECLETIRSVKMAGLVKWSTMV